jgi:hypothetical protein
VRNAVPLNFEQLQMRIMEFNGMEVDKFQFVDMLKERLSTADINQVKADVQPFVKNPHDMDIWSNNYFVQLAGMIMFQ